MTKKTPVRKSVLASLALSVLISAGFAVAEETPTYRYLTVPYKLNKFGEGSSIENYKLCGIPMWAVETSGYPEKLKVVKHVKMRTSDAIAQTGGACDFVLVRWDILKNRKTLQEAIDARGLVDIPSLTKTR